MCNYFQDNSQRGQSLIEILFAITIFTIGVVTIGYLVIDAKTMMRYSTDMTEARLLATEGLEAVTSIQVEDFGLLSEGDFGLVIEDGSWSLSIAPDQQEKFSRTISIENIDVNIKDVTSTVTWKILSGKEKNISYTTRLYNWMQNDRQAGSLAVDDSGVSVVASSTKLSGLVLENIGAENIMLTKMVVEWSGLPKLSLITLEGVDLYTASTSGLVGSGEEIDVLDYQLVSSSWQHVLDGIEFDGELPEDTNFIVRFVFEDDSERSVYVTP